MNWWSLFFLASGLVFISMYFIFGLVGVFAFLIFWLFAFLIIWDLSERLRICAIPYCGKIAMRGIRGPKGIFYLCKEHFNELMSASEYVKKGTSRVFFTEERRRRMFNPNEEERTIINYLVNRQILEPSVIGGKPSYKPTEKFHNMVAEAKLKLFFTGYILDMKGMTEQGTKIAIKQSIPDASREDAAKYSEITSQFVYWDEMDRELNPLRRRKTSSFKHTYIV